MLAPVQDAPPTREPEAAARLSVQAEPRLSFNGWVALIVVALVFRSSLRNRVHAQNAFEEDRVPAEPRPDYSEVASSSLAVDVTTTPAPTRRQQVILQEKERLRIEAENLQIRAALAAERQERIKAELRALEEADAREAEQAARLDAERRARVEAVERERIAKELRKVEKRAKRGKK